MTSLRELKTCFEQLNIEKTYRAIVLTGSGRTFTTGTSIDLLSSCDIPDTSRDKTLCIKEVDMSLAADISTPQILPKSITNHNHFQELIYTSRAFTSDEAQQIGLISHVFDARDTIINAVISLANILALKSPIAVQGSNINLNYAHDHTVDDNFNFTCTWNISVILGEDILKRNK